MSALTVASKKLIPRFSIFQSQNMMSIAPSFISFVSVTVILERHNFHLGYIGIFSVFLINKGFLFSNDVGPFEAVLSSFLSYNPPSIERFEQERSLKFKLQNNSTKVLKVVYVHFE